jgi:hypothetical protein
VSKLTAAEKKQQKRDEWNRKNEKTIALFLFLKELVQAKNQKIEDFELEGYTYVKASEHKPIPTFTFENSRHTRTVGIYGYDSDIDGRFFINAHAPKKIDLYIKNIHLTPNQSRDLKVKLDAAVVEQDARHAA